MLLQIIVGASLLQIIAAEGTTLYPPTCSQMCLPQEGSKGFPGMHGLRGSMGDKGATGPRGQYPPWWHWHYHKGLPGPPGLAGKPGDPGRPGPEGERGAKCFTGRPGSPGVKGDTGLEGGDGLPGFPGERGRQGDMGFLGRRGDKGMQGRKGMDGLDGIPGIEGMPGDSGDIGDRGDNGDPGLSGSDGSKGVKGDMGDHGLNATAKTMQALKGDKGRKGDKGNPGVKGNAGFKGTNGLLGPPIKNENDVLTQPNLCTKRNEGQMYHDATTKDIVFCDGEQWKCTESSSCETCVEETVYRVRDMPKPLAADVVLIIDDSSSMENEQDWIPSAAIALEDSLLGNGIGNGTLKNKYYVVLFANIRTYSVSYLENRTSIVTVDGNVSLDASQVGEAMSKFSKSGNLEDGYQAIELALSISELRQRDDVALNLLLATDEPRDPMTLERDYPPGAPPGTDSSLEIVQKKLLERNARLNVLLGKMSFQSNAFSDIIAVDYKGVVHGSGDKAFDSHGFKNLTVSMVADNVDSEYLWEEACREFIEYAPLAMSTGGALWSLAQIDKTRLNPAKRAEFTNDIARIKLQEVTSQRCVECNVTKCDNLEREEVCNSQIDQAYCRCRASGKTDEECRGAENAGEVNNDYWTLYDQCSSRNYPSTYTGWCDPNWPFGIAFNGSYCGSGASAWRYYT